MRPTEAEEEAEVEAVEEAEAREEEAAEASAEKEKKEESTEAEVEEEVAVEEAEEEETEVIEEIDMEVAIDSEAQETPIPQLLLELMLLDKTQRVLPTKSTKTTKVDMDIMVDMTEEVEPVVVEKSRKEVPEDTDGEILMKIRNMSIWEPKKLPLLLKLPQKLQPKVLKILLKKPRLKLSHNKRRKKRSTT